MNSHQKKWLAAGVFAAVVIGGGTSIAAASGGGDTTSGKEHQQENERDDPSFTGSVPAPAGTEQPDGAESGTSDGQEAAALQALASISQQQAEQAALAAVPGTVAETDLDAENGFVVYSVEVNGAGGTVTEVTVDAGNGAVLAQQAQDASDPADGPDNGGPGDAQD